MSSVQKKKLSVWKKVGVYIFALAIIPISVISLMGMSSLIEISQRQLKLAGDNLSLQSVNFGIVPPVQAYKPVLTRQLIDKGITSPDFSALAILAMDFDSGKILYSKNINSRLSPASTTKIMTALVGSEYYSLDQNLKVLPRSTVGGSSMGLKIGEELTFRSLLYGMMLNSGNDAAFVIAANFPGGVENFVRAMNQKSDELGLIDTHFENPAGFDGVNHYSSADDLAKIAKELMKNPQLATIVGTKDTQVVATNNGRLLSLHNLNQLLSEPGVLGIKTGFTEKSGENLVGLMERNGLKILTVVLGSEDRFGETRSLAEWIYTNYQLDWR